MSAPSYKYQIPLQGTFQIPQDPQIKFLINPVQLTGFNNF